MVEFILGILVATVAMLCALARYHFIVMGQVDDTIQQIVEAINSPPEREPVMGFYMPQDTSELDDYDDDDYEDKKRTLKGKKGK